MLQRIKGIKIIYKIGLLCIISISLVLICVYFKSCSSIPPGMRSVERQLERNYDDIMIIVDYMIASKYESISIDDTDGWIWADFKDIKIKDEAVLKSVKNLIDENEYISIYKNNNTIEFAQWEPFVIDKGCGIAYSIDNITVPDVQYAVKMLPLEKAGWYYYVDDYNEWRSENS